MLTIITSAGKLTLQNESLQSTKQKQVKYLCKQFMKHDRSGLREHYRYLVRFIVAVYTFNWDCKVFSNIYFVNTCFIHSNNYKLIRKLEMKQIHKVPRTIFVVK